MAIDFTLTDSQKKLQKITREFATEILAPAVQKADEEPDTQKAFQMMKGPYKEAYKLGLAICNLEVAKVGVVGCRRRQTMLNPR